MDRSSTEEREQRGTDGREVLNDKTKYKRDNGHYYRNLVLSCLITFFTGNILCAFLDTFGFGAFLFGCLLFALGVLFSKII